MSARRGRPCSRRARAARHGGGPADRSRAPTRRRGPRPGRGGPRHPSPCRHPPRRSPPGLRPRPAAAPDRPRRYRPHECAFAARSIPVRSIRQPWPRTSPRPVTCWIPIGWVGTAGSPPRSGGAASFAIRAAGSTVRAVRQGLRTACAPRPVGGAGAVLEGAPERLDRRWARPWSGWTALAARAPPPRPSWARLRGLQGCGSSPVRSRRRPHPACAGRAGLSCHGHASMGSVSGSPAWNPARV